MFVFQHQANAAKVIQMAGGFVERYPAFSAWNPASEVISGNRCIYTSANTYSYEYINVSIYLHLRMYVYI